MALYHKLGVKTGFTFALQFFMLISDGLGGVYVVARVESGLELSQLNSSPQV